MCHFVGLPVRFIDPGILEGVLGSVKGRKPYIIFTGGEPFLHPEIFKMINIAKEKGFFVLLVSNGTLLRDRAEEIVHSGLDVLIISLDGTGEVHDIIRGKVGLFETVIEGLKTLLSKRVKAKRSSWFFLRPALTLDDFDDLISILEAVENSNKGVFRGVSEVLGVIERSQTKKVLRSPRVYVNCTLNPLNVEQLMPLYSVVSDLGVDGINYQHIWLKPSDSHYDFDGSRLDRETEGMLTFRNKWEEIGSKLFQFGAREAGLGFIIPNFFFPRISGNEMDIYYSSPEKFVGGRRTPYCAWFYASIDSCGKVVQCGDLEMGDLEKESFGHIWNSKDYREFRRNLREKEVLPSCSRCCYYFRKVWM